MVGNMRIKHWLLITLLSVLVLALAVTGLRFIKIEAEQTRYTSAMSWLNAQLRESLSVYYANHNRYPEVLSKLEISKYDDNATPEMLSNFFYSADEKSYTLKWATKKGNTITQSGRFGTNSPINNSAWR